MADLTLSFVSNFNERVEPLMNGTVKADGIEIIPTYSHPSETFWRQLKFQEFQVAEMSMSSFLIARSRGADMIALPVFPSRRFRYQGTRRSKRQAHRRRRISANRGALGARRFGARLRRIAIQSPLVYGTHRRIEPRRRHRFHATARHFISPHTTGQEHGNHARQS